MLIHLSFLKTVASPSAKSVWQMIHLVGDINILNVGDIEPRDYSDAIPGGSDLEALKNEIRNLAASHQASLFCSTHCRWFRSFNNSTWSCGKIRLLLLWPSLPLILLLALMSTEKHRFSPRHERFLDAPLGRVQALIWEFNLFHWYHSGCHVRAR